MYSANLPRSDGGTYATTRVPSARNSSSTMVPTLWISFSSSPLLYGTRHDTMAVSASSASSIVLISSSTPSPLFALVRTTHSGTTLLCTSAQSSTTSSSRFSSNLSHLFRTMICGVSSTMSSSIILCTLQTCCLASGDDASTTCKIRLASSSSSRVARKDVTSLVGSFWIKPTVSVMSVSFPPGSLMRRVVGSRVAKRRSSA
mmetsp:Transcript_50543/g.123263  ORF Transcript_50543/g.123263 Transcript_50543/m.123263 type:complete len:202 (+) Transcript_50543:364-969(+)